MWYLLNKEQYLLTLLLGRRYLFIHLKVLIVVLFLTSLNTEMDISTFYVCNTIIVIIAIIAF